MPTNTPIEEQRESLLRMESFLLEVADAINTTLDLETLMRRVAEFVRRIIHYDVFAILLLNERSQTLRIRFSMGHSREAAERIRVKLGEGITGQAAQRGEAVLVNNVLQDPKYIASGAKVLSELAVPLILKGRVIGVIDVEASASNFFTEEHRSVLTLLASRVAIGVENARLYTRVSRQAKQLLLLNEISRELTSILQQDELFKRIGELLKKIIDYHMFTVLLLNPGGTKLQHRFALRFKENVQFKHEVPLGRGLVGQAAERNEVIVVPDVTRDPRYVPLNPETLSELCVPLVYKGQVIGVLDMEHTRRGYFTGEHARMMKTLAAQIAISIENARLYETIAHQERRMETDLMLARELQYRLLPQKVPQTANAEFAARALPARTVGGDFYDFIYHASSGYAALAAADVSGKGAPAAIFSALSSGILRAQAAEEPGAAEMLAEVNRSLDERPIAAQFVCIVYAQWDDASLTLRVANSGQPYPLRCSARGKAKHIEIGGHPLGLFPNSEYDEVTFHARPGDVFLFYSDGITDAQNSRGVAFGTGRLARVLEKYRKQPANEIVGAVFDAVNRFVGRVEAFDDQTVAVLKVKDPVQK
ncbi:MAG: GAF domain-containing protein [Acidobacteriota bacterium]|nr:GAF domain-containing protein [Acidobacteriota bacterium]